MIDMESEMEVVAYYFVVVVVEEAGHCEVQVSCPSLVVALTHLDTPSACCQRIAAEDQRNSFPVQCLRPEPPVH